MDKILGQTGWAGNKPFWPRELWADEIRYFQRGLFEEIVHSSHQDSLGILAWRLTHWLDYRFPSIPFIEESILILDFI